MPDITARARRFKIGDAVSLAPAHGNKDMPSGLYKIVRLMPAEGQDYQYRIQEGRTGGEYVVRERELK